ncbi:hypothetical protein [Microvirga sp. VF16]|uniref:hypothetical protein n=1 Tax=Microvirga sp. VF16 TaxID=2807101 RepID=UPI00193E56E1|nr:hypothetical protein [Microvirga sp. VF16]QRM34940.1 hypothetical protein JO965_42530 [Microvirga sp. VF16]
MVRLKLVVLGVMVSTAATAAEISQAEKGVVCRAAVGSVTGRDPSIMMARPDGDVTHVSYSRPSDGSVWSYRCRLEGNRVIWASAEGRWRTHPDNGVLTYEMVEGGKIRIVEAHSNGSKSEDTYDRKDLR